MLITFLSFIVVIGVLIFVHELGHFMTAKMVDIEVPKFSIGLGPKLWGFRRGETEYVISWLPLGGYVKMAGMEELESIEGKTEPSPTIPVTDLGLTSEEPTHHGRSRDFESKSLPARALVISAGVIMNVLFAFVIFSLTAFVWGVLSGPESRVASVQAEELPDGTEALVSIPANAKIVSVGSEEVEDWSDVQRAFAMTPPGLTQVRLDNGQSIAITLPKNDSLRATTPRALVPAIPAVIGGVQPGLPADRAGLQAGDRIVQAGGQPVSSFHDVVRIVEGSAGQPLPLIVDRGGERLALEVTPEMPSSMPDGTAPRPRIGVEVAGAGERDRLGLGGSLVYGADQTWYWISATTKFLGQLFTGQQSARNLGGPILIGQVSGKVARAGLEAFLSFMAVFSINLAVLNLLPIPILDGGQLVFLGVEGIRGKALSLEQRMRLSQVGFVLVLAIMVWAVANDVLRLFGI